MYMAKLASLSSRLFSSAVVIVALQLCNPLLVAGQSLIQGVINNYTQVTQVDICHNQISCSGTTGFLSGDTVLLIQMQGATIDLNNGTSFGSITSYNSAGNYELGQILSIAGNIITLKNRILRTYDVNGRVQLIKVPHYSNASITAPLTCTAWNGTTGGVLILSVSGTLTFNADIDVSGKGFRGAVLYNAAGCINTLGGFTSYYSPIVSENGAYKGEGIYEVTNTNYEAAMGAVANGGGGGNDHNGGGGGGSNAGSGGMGGQRLNFANISCPCVKPGLGGYNLTYNNTNNQVFMGGGGGAGHENNNLGSGGMAGGGIVIILANNVVGNAHSIIANGLDQTYVTAGDGAGGGGGGGSVLISVLSFAPGILNVNANGGKGGDSNNGFATTSCTGPGGGGGGGVIWSATGLPGSVLTTVNGGQHGSTTNANANASCFAANVIASDGANGQTLTGLLIPVESTTFNVFAISASATPASGVCPGSPVNLTASGSTTGYSWTPPNNLSCTNCTNPVATPLITAQYTVTSTDVYGCTASVNLPVTIFPAPQVILGNDSTFCLGQSIQLNAFTTANSFSWSPSSGLSCGNCINPLLTPVSAGAQSYILTVTDANNCSVSDTFTAHVLAHPVANAGTDTILFIGESCLLQASGLGDNYCWSVSAGGTCINPNSQLPSFLVTPDSSRFYYLLMQYAANSCGTSTDSVYVQVVNKDIVLLPSAFTPNGDGNNDTLRIIAQGIKELKQFEIYNRWGDKVFSTNKLTDGWDGNYGGKPQQNEVYTYVIQAVNLKGKSKIVKGNVTLMR